MISKSYSNKSSLFRDPIIKVYYSYVWAGITVLLTTEPGR